MSTLWKRPCGTEDLGVFCKDEQEIIAFRAGCIRFHSAMGNDILREVVAVEKEIQQRIEVEKRLAYERIEQAKKEAEKEISQEEERLRRSWTTVLEEARAGAEIQAAGILEKAAAEAEFLKCLNDEILGEIIINHIIRILPGGNDDRQDVKG